MKPHEFWDSTYREVALYVESRSLQYEQEVKTRIHLVKDIYPELFKEELARHSAFERKASEGEDLVNLMLELTEELRQETKGKE